MRSLLPRASALALILSAPLASAADQALPLWRSLDWFKGAWAGVGTGMLGDGRSLRCTQDLFGGRFMLTRTRTTMKTQSGPRDLGDFQHWQVIGRDPDSGRITLEQYESAGYHRRFELVNDASRSDLLVFEATELGDASPDRAGRLLLRVLGVERYEEVLELGENADSMREVRSDRWRRAEDAADLCDEEGFDLPPP